MPMSQQAAMMMQPFMIPMVGFYCTPSAFGNSMNETQTAGMSPQKAPEQEHEIPEETGEKPHSESDEEVYYHLVESYNHAGQWRAVKKGLFIKATQLPAIESCYVEKRIATTYSGVLSRTARPSQKSSLAASCIWTLQQWRRGPFRVQRHRHPHIMV